MLSSSRGNIAGTSRLFLFGVLLGLGGVGMAAAADPRPDRGRPAAVAVGRLELAAAHLHHLRPGPAARHLQELHARDGARLLLVT